MTVYTFWEPREKMPYYIKLCMETWKKNLPNAEIVLLDYKNLGEYIDVKEFNPILFSGRFKLALIADALRVALLAKHGVNISGMQVGKTAIEGTSLMVLTIDNPLPAHVLAEMKALEPIFDVTPIAYAD